MKKILFTILLSFSFRAVHVYAAPNEQNYGADEANNRYFRKNRTAVEAKDYDYLALRDHPGPSGVPLGGIGVGCLDLAPDGRFTRIALNNIHQPLDARAGKESFFTLWIKNTAGTTVRRLQRNSEQKNERAGYAHSDYTGLFPRAEINFFDTPDGAPEVTLAASSGLVPHDIKNSSLPVVWFEVSLRAPEDSEVSVAFSWESILGRGLYDPESTDGFDGPLFEGGRLKLADAPRAWPRRSLPAVEIQPYARAGWSGIQQHSLEVRRPRKATFQNYITDTTILGDSSSGKISLLLQSNEGGAEWREFAKNGTFSEKRSSARESPGHSPFASAVAIKSNVRKGETKTFRFILAWYFPELVIDPTTDALGSYWGKGDYGRYFHNHFSSLDELADYAVTKGTEIREKTIAWQQPILSSTLPDWLKFKLINSAYPIYTNTILNKAGEFTVLEGAMGGLAGTIDQRLSAHPFIQKMFPELDRAELGLFAEAQEKNGAIPHFLGHYYVGMMSHGGSSPTAGETLVDATASWLIQLAKNYAQTAEADFVRRYETNIRSGFAYLRSRMKGGVPIPVGPATYDDHPHPAIYSYNASIYLATLRAGEVLAAALGDAALAQSITRQFKESQTAAIKYLWNGSFFAYGANINGGRRRDDLLFTGQLAGQFLSRYAGWGDIFPFEMVRSAIEHQLKTSIAQSPDYYADKLWSIPKARGVDQPGSRCWPFYLESYTALPAIQAGFVEDGMELLRHLQLVHLREGYTWTQNLWNPGEVTYMSAPVTWFVTDVLAGANLDLSHKILGIAPILTEGKPLRLPLYFPSFWADLEIDPTKNKAEIKITKLFTSAPPIITHLRAESAGRATSTGKLTTLAAQSLREGTTLDLSAYLDQFTTVPEPSRLLRKQD